MTIHDFDDTLLAVWYRFYLILHKLPWEHSIGPLFACTISMIFEGYIYIYITKAGGVFLNTLQTPFLEEFLSLSFTLKKRRVLHSTDHSRRSWTYNHCSCSSWQVFVQWALLLYSSLPSQQSRASEERKIHTANAIVDFGRENETAQMTLVFAIKFHFIASS